MIKLHWSHTGLPLYLNTQHVAYVFQGEYEVCIELINKTIIRVRETMEEVRSLFEGKP